MLGCGAISAAAALRGRRAAGFAAPAFLPAAVLRGVVAFAGLRDVAFAAAAFVVLRAAAFGAALAAVRRVAVLAAATRRPVAREAVVRAAGFFAAVVFFAAVAFFAVVVFFAAAGFLAAVGFFAVVVAAFLRGVAAFAVARAGFFAAVVLRVVPVALRVEARRVGARIASADARRSEVSVVSVVM